MGKNIKWLGVVLFLVVGFFLPEGTSQGAEAISIIANPAKQEAGKNADFPIFELPMPQNESEKVYLGLSGNGNFKVEQTNAQVLIIEVFSFYCPHCQRMASQVNGLYQKIQEWPDMKEKIKMIGIGASNSIYEVDSYKERYRVPFPLFPDQDTEISQMLGVRGTPTFIGVKVNGKGTRERFYFGEGGFQDTQQFLDEIIKLSGLK